MQPQPQLTTQPQPEPLPLGTSLHTALDRVHDLIPDYDWTCVYGKLGCDLLHIPTGIFIESTERGYEIHQLNNPHTFYFMDDSDNIDTYYTTDARVAVREWLAHVIRTLAQQAIEGK